MHLLKFVFKPVKSAGSFDALEILWTMWRKFQSGAKSASERIQNFRHTLELSFPNIKKVFSLCRKIGRAKRLSNITLNNSLFFRQHAESGETSTNFVVTSFYNRVFRNVFFNEYTRNKAVKYFLAILSEMT